MSKHIITESDNVDLLVRHKKGYTKLNVYEFLNMSIDDAKNVLESSIGSSNIIEGDFDTLLNNIHTCFALEAPKKKKSK